MKKIYEQPYCEIIAMTAQQVIAVSEGGVSVEGPGNWGWPNEEITI